jgi:uncharacterized repeat protein (TIGR01451 family)
VEYLEDRTVPAFAFPTNPGTTYLMNATDISGILGTFGTTGLPSNASTTKDELMTVFQLNSVLANGGGTNYANGFTLTGMVGDLTPIAHYRPSSPGSTTGTFLSDITPSTGPLVVQQGDLLFFGALGRNPLSTTGNPPSSTDPAQTGGGYVIVSDTTGTGFGFNATGQGRNETMQNLSLKTGGQSVTGGTDSNLDNFINTTGAAIENGNIVVAARFEDLTALGKNGTFAAPSGFNYTNAALVSLMNTVATNTGQDTVFLEEGNVGNGTGPFGTEATNAVGTGLLDVVGGTSASSFAQTTFNNTNTFGSVPFGGPAKIALTLQSQFNFSATNYTQFQAGSNDPLNYIGTGKPSLQITKTPGKTNSDGSNFTPLPPPATINLGDTAAYKITITNVGTGSATNVNLNDLLPRDPEGTGTGILNWSIASQSPTTPLATISDPTPGDANTLDDDTLTWNIGNLAGGATDTITVYAPTTPLLLAHSSDPGAPLPMNLFQLDGNAQVSNLGTPNQGWTGDDWDNVLSVLPPNSQFINLSNAPTQPGLVKSGVSFTTDPFNGNDNIFTVGSKDTVDVNDPNGSWTWTTSTAPDKADLEHAYTALYEVPSTNPNVPPGTEDQILFFGTERYATNGATNLGFWFFHQPVGPVGGPTGGGFSGHHTAGNADPSNDPNPGDVFIVCSFTQGGAVSTIAVYEWVGFNASNKGLGDSNDLFGSPKWKPNGPLQIRFNINVPPNPTTDGIFAVTNTPANNPGDGSTPSPWTYTPKSGTANVFPPESFFEGGINLSHFGLAGCFTSFLAETRASPSPGAELKDFVGGHIATCAIVNAAATTFVTWVDPTTGNPNTTHISNDVEIDIVGTGSGQTQQATAGTAAPGGAAAPQLQDSQLQLYVQEAIARWQSAGLSGAALNELRNTPVHVGDLPGGDLGMESPVGIVIDSNAAGYGWYLDPTPGNDSEFLLPGNQGEQGHVDLLTVVMHEMGHTLGLSDLYNPGASQDLMYEFLGTGQRRTPSPADVAEVQGPQTPLVGTTPAPNSVRMAHSVGARPQTLSIGTGTSPIADQAILSTLTATVTTAPVAAGFTTVPRSFALAANLPASVTTLPLDSTALMVRHPGTDLVAALRDRSGDPEEGPGNDLF